MNKSVRWAGGLYPGDKITYRGKPAKVADAPIPWISETPGEVPIILEGRIAYILVPLDDLSTDPLL
jgi:hypothetical protein